MLIELVPLHCGVSKYAEPGEVIREQILMKQDGYPAALFHVDLLWNTPEHKDIHERLMAGETLTVEVTFKEVQND